MMNLGWLKIHRELLNWEWYDDLNVRVLFLHLLITVNYEDKKWRGIMIKKGSRITGRIQLSNESGLTEQNVRTAIKKLELTKELTIQKTPNGSMFTVVNWEKYQEGNQQTNHQTNQELTRDQPETNQRLTRDQPQLKKYKNIKKDKEIKKESDLSALEFIISEKEIEYNDFEMQNKKMVNDWKNLTDSFQDQIAIEISQGKIEWEVEQLLPRLKKWTRSWIKNQNSGQKSKFNQAQVNNRPKYLK